MSSFYRYTNLVTRGNLGLFPSGQKVVSPIDGQKYNGLRNGEPVLYDPVSGNSLDVADIATAKAVRFGVGYSPDGGLLATQIRHLGGGNNVDLCKTNLDIKIEQSGCATPQVIDFDFGCTITGKSYLIGIDIDDWFKRSYFKEGANSSLLIDMLSELSGCQNCSEAENCAELACQAAAKINGMWLKHYPGTNRLGMNTDKPGHGLFAAQKFVNNVSITIPDSNEEAGCGAGCAVKGITGISATGLDLVPLVNTTDPAAPGQTLVEQLPTVRDQINAALAGKGHAYIKKLDCCNYSIEINSCLEDITIRFADNSTSTGTVTPAFSSYTPNQPCVGCDEPQTAEFTCGVRIYVDPLELPCHCAYPDGNPPSWFGRKVTIDVLGEGWKNTSYKVTEVEKQTVWQGTGYQVQLNELMQSNGGEGFDYAYGKDYTPGHIPLPAPGSAAANASVAKCDDMYCIWSVVTEDHLAGYHHARHVSNSQTVNWVNVPRQDLNTIEVIQDVFQALANRGFCNSVNWECVDFES